MSRSKTSATFLISAILGFIVWWLAIPLTGQVEAWDANSYFFTALIIAGLLSGLLGGFLGEHRSWLHCIAIYVGIVVGIIARMFTHPAGGPSLLIAGLFLLVFYLLPSFVASATGVWITARLKPKT